MAPYEFEFEVKFDSGSARGSGDGYGSRGGGDSGGGSGGDGGHFLWETGGNSNHESRVVISTSLSLSLSPARLREGSVIEQLLLVIIPHRRVYERQLLCE